MLVEHHIYNKRESDHLRHSTEMMRSSLTTANTFNRTIYVDPVSGDDANSGDSATTPIKSLAQLPTWALRWRPDITKGWCATQGAIVLRDLQPTSPTSFMHVGSYGDKKARIDLKGELAGVVLSNVSNIFVTDIKLSGNGGAKNEQEARSGAEIQSSVGSEKTDNITIYNVDIRDIYYYN